MEGQLPIGKRALVRWGFALLSLSLVALLIDWLASPEVTPLKVARIEGDLRHLKRSDLERAISEQTGGGFFTVDLQAIKQAAQALPWVARVSVRRVWPDTLHIWVVEQTPLARWGEGQLVNHEGEVFAPAKETIPAGLPLLKGPDGSGAEMVRHYELAKGALQGIGLTLEGMELSKRQAWTLLLSQGITLRLGVDGFETRLQRFVQHYPSLRESRVDAMAVVDMRYDNGLAVKWEEKRVKADTPS